MNENASRLIIFIFVAALHAILLGFLVFNLKTAPQEVKENARVMKLTDLSEAPPPPPVLPPPSDEDYLPQVESIAENMIETNTAPVQNVAPAGTFVPNQGNSWDDYLPMHRVSQPPRFDEKEITAAIVYPPIAQRSGIEGRVILELFIDKSGYVQRISVLAENPPDRGFAEAAIRVFTGKRCVPAQANGAPVSARYRYPVTFTLKRSS